MKLFEEKVGLMDCIQMNFLTLKWFHVIDMPWIAVLTPLWIILISYFVEHLFLVMKGSKKGMNHSSSASGGLGFIGALQLVFIVLKLIGYIHWRWLMVLSPIWISTILFVALLLVIAVAALFHK